MLVDVKTPFPVRPAAATTPSSPPWRPPVSDAVGWRGPSHAGVRAAALDDIEPDGIESGDEHRRGSDEHYP